MTHFLRYSMEQKKIWLSLAEMGGREQKFIQEAFDTNWVVPLGPNVNGFEEDLTRYLGEPGKYVIALSAGTAALHLGLVMLGVGRDDEVICQSFTFSASANPITYQGASPYSSIASLTRGICLPTCYVKPSRIASLRQDASLRRSYQFICMVCPPRWTRY